MKKICPIMSCRLEGEGYVECLGDRCALWDDEDERCTIVDASHALWAIYKTM